MTKLTTRTAVLIVMRHGEKDPNGGADAQNTPQGKIQICMAARNYLEPIHLDATYSSELDRALDVALLAQRFTKDPTILVPDQRIELGFSQLDSACYLSAMEQTRNISADNEPVTLGHWWNWQPGYMQAAKDQYTDAYCRVAKSLVQQYGDRSIALIGNHAPVCQSCMEDLAIPVLGEAGIIEYRVTVTGPVATITSSSVIFPGY